MREKEGKGREERIKRRKDSGRNYTRDSRSVKVHFCGEEGETSWAPARKNTSWVFASPLIPREAFSHLKI